jgi:anti-sigma B factor antagonist
LSRRLDAAGLSLIERDFSETIAAHKGKVLAGMSDVNFVASLAVRMLLMGLKAIQPQIAEIFRKSRFDTLFKTYADCEAALVHTLPERRAFINGAHRRFVLPLCKHALAK